MGFLFCRYMTYSKCCRILNNPSNRLPKDFLIFLPKWRNFAKSGREKFLATLIKVWFELWPHHWRSEYRSTIINRSWNKVVTTDKVLRPYSNQIGLNGLDLVHFRPIWSHCLMLSQCRAQTCRGRTPAVAGRTRALNWRRVRPTSGRVRAIPSCCSSRAWKSCLVLGVDMKTIFT